MDSQEPCQFSRHLETAQIAIRMSLNVHLAAAGATLAWDALDPTNLPPGKLEIQQQ